MNCVDNSVFDIFKIGPGPSSSHTIGPMLAGNLFRERILALDPESGILKIHFYGSLALTGVGHGSDRAVIAGLLGWKPESCDTGEVQMLTADAARVFTVGKIRFTSAVLTMHTGAHSYPFQNTIRFELGDAGGAVIAEMTVYSIGGGFIRVEGTPEPAPRKLPWRYRDMSGFYRVLEKSSLSPVELLLENEIAVSGGDAAGVRRKLGAVLRAMFAAVERGLAADGVLPGSIHLHRRARRMYEAARKLPDGKLLLLDSFALAAAEENAAGSRIVTAPTSGSSGLLAGLVYWLKNEQGVSEERLIDGLLIAGMIGSVARSNASISGAEVGCQGEIGVAAAMAAGLVAYLEDGSMRVTECAAEIALEHHLGMTCDPVDGYVQIPCIERNAVSAVTAFNAARMAVYGDARGSKVSFDEVLEAMAQTGGRMAPEFKETGLGGLAVCSHCC